MQLAPIDSNRTVAERHRNIRQVAAGSDRNTGHPNRDDGKGAGTILANPLEFGALRKIVFRFYALRWGLQIY